MVTIQEIVKNRNRVTVRLDNGEQFWLTQSDVLTHGCYEGQEFDPETFYQLIRLCQYPSALNRAVSMLARRPCSREDIRRKLIFRHYTEEIAELVLFKLEKEKLVDDVSFCEQWIHYRQLRGYGPSLIRRELKMKGIPDSVIQECLDRQTDDDDTNNAVIMARKARRKLKPSDDEHKNRQKVIQYLVRKGYDWDTARSAAEAAESE